MENGELENSKFEQILLSQKPIFNEKILKRSGVAKTFC